MTSRICRSSLCMFHKAVHVLPSGGIPGDQRQHQRFSE